MAMIVPVVDQRQLPVAELAGTGDGVVDVGQRDVRVGADDDVAAAVGQRELAAALQRDAVLDELELGARCRSS